VTRYALTLEFDGGPFVGLQRQLDAPTIQLSVERAVLRTTGEATNMVAAGRTDSGVHAFGMRAHVEIAKPIDPFRLMEALNYHLRPDPIAVLDCVAVPDDWHARFSCIGRSYVYRIANRRAPLTLDVNRAWLINQKLDAQIMHEAAQILVGTHDFTTFRSVHCQSKTPIKTLESLDVQREGEYIIIQTAARSYLHHQVRSMVGCLALVGMGRWPVERIAQALAARDRTQLGLNAPSCGLYFDRAFYPEG